MSFAALPSTDKAQRLLSAAISAAKEYYECSGIHIGESAIEHFLQVRIWEAISEKGKVFCTMETSPSDILRWSGVKNGGTIIQTGRFDVVFCGAGRDEKPRGIIELKVGRKSEEFAADFKRIYEFSELANKSGAEIQSVAALFVERLTRGNEKQRINEGVEVLLDDHKKFVDGRCEFPKQWKFERDTYKDRISVKEIHELVAGVAWADIS
jgi:hypothetical protein